jgi:hypothetical protein
MGKVSATVTTTQKVSIAPKVLKKLRQELNGYGAVQREAKTLTTAKGEHSAAVLALSLEGVDGDKYELEGYKVAVVKDAKNRKLNTSKLIKRMVKDGKYSIVAAQALIEDCTDETPKKPHVRITCPGESDEE